MALISEFRASSGLTTRTLSDAPVDGRSLLCSLVGGLMAAGTCVESVSRAAIIKGRT
jgi:hypothetical protein